MLIDAHELSSEQVISVDICIVGSGPAGITLAREFLGQRQQVCLLESGGVELNPQVQALSQAETTGDPYLAPHLTRHRQFGGNSNIWSIKIGNGEIGVRYVPLDEIDFEQRDWLPYSGWPLTKADLDPFYERAQVVCQAGPYAYSADFWQTDDAAPLPLKTDRLVTNVFQFGPRHVFYQHYREELKQAENIKICVNATVLDIEADELAQTVKRLRVASTPDRQFWVEAKVFVLATGGIENARLLLASNQQQPTGLGNHHDLVGRYFMDHALVDGGMFTPSDPGLYDRMALYDLRRVNNAPILGRLGLSKQTMQQEHLLNFAAVLFPRPSQRQFDAIVAFKGLAESLLDKTLPSHLPSEVFKILAGLDYVVLSSYLAATKHQSLAHGFGRGGWSELSNNQRRFKAFQVFFLTEQAPDPANRVTLSSQRDSFGVPKAEVHWKWGDFNNQSIARSQEILAEELSRAGLGTYQIKRNADGQPDVCYPAGLAHHLGTTRMHPDPKQGVVDVNGRVHGISNLFMTGSSVFPTGSYANPTLTIVALSLRLAGHLTQVLEQQTVEIH
jgi:choline dehydrogenase-like flavoprotein